MIMIWEGLRVKMKESEVNLNLEADDTPPRHANVVGWPWRDDDPEFGKSERKFKAATLGQRAERLEFP